MPLGEVPANSSPAQPSPASSEYPQAGPCLQGAKREAWTSQSSMLLGPATCSEGHPPDVPHLSIPYPMHLPRGPLGPLRGCPTYPLLSQERGPYSPPSWPGRATEKAQDKKTMGWVVLGGPGGSGRSPSHGRCGGSPGPRWSPLAVRGKASWPGGCITVVQNLRLMGRWPVSRRPPCLLCMELSCPPSV